MRRHRTATRKRANDFGRPCCARLPFSHHDNGRTDGAARCGTAGAREPLDFHIFIRRAYKHDKKSETKTSYSSTEHGRVVLTRPGCRPTNRDGRVYGEFITSIIIILV